MIEKPLAYKKLLTILDYIEAKDYIDQVLGYDQRDAHVHFKPELPHVDPEGNDDGQQDRGTYLDYWHYVMEFQFNGISNDSYLSGTYSFVEFAEQTEKEFGEQNWRSIIARTWANEYPGKYTIWMSW